jgi:phosphoglycerate dehydrogenase-like enzyme
MQKFAGPVLVLIAADERQRSLLLSRLPVGQEISYRSAKAVTQAEVQEAAVILGNPPVEWLPSCSQLKLLHLFSSGAEQYLLPSVLPPETQLCLMKKLHIYRDNQASANWQSAGKVTSIWKSRILIIGTGDIGGDFARRVKACGAYTIGVRRHRVDCPEWLDELHTPDAIDSLLPTVDVIALSVPGSPETRHLLSADRINLLKPGAFVLNVGRGAAIDTDALVAALENGQLGGAGLDVTDPEPLPPDHPLWHLQNALVTPHIAGGFQLPETRERVIKIWAENLDRFFKGESLRNRLL